MNNHSPSESLPIMITQHKSSTLTKPISQGMGLIPLLYSISNITKNNLCYIPQTDPPKEQIRKESQNKFASPLKANAQGFLRTKIQGCPFITKSDSSIPRTKCTKPIQEPNMQDLSKNSYAKSIQDQPFETYSRTKYTEIYIQESNI